MLVQCPYYYGKSTLKVIDSIVKAVNTKMRATLRYFHHVSFKVMLLNKIAIISTSEKRNFNCKHFR